MNKKKKKKSKWEGEKKMNAKINQQEVTESRDDNFAPRSLTRPVWSAPPCFAPRRFSPPHKGDGARFQPRTMRRGKDGLGLDFLDLTRPALIRVEL